MSIFTTSKSLPSIGLLHLAMDHHELKLLLCYRAVQCLEWCASCRFWQVGGLEFSVWILDRRHPVRKRMNAKQQAPKPSLHKAAVRDLPHPHPYCVHRRGGSAGNAASGSEGRIAAQASGAASVGCLGGVRTGHGSNCCPPQTAELSGFPPASSLFSMPAQSWLQGVKIWELESRQLGFHYSSTDINPASTYAGGEIPPSLWLSLRTVSSTA